MSASAHARISCSAKSALCSRGCPWRMSQQMTAAVSTSPSPQCHRLPSGNSRKAHATNHLVRRGLHHAREHTAELLCETLFDVRGINVRGNVSSCRYGIAIASIDSQAVQS